MFLLIIILISLNKKKKMHSNNIDKMVWAPFFLLQKCSFSLKSKCLKAIINFINCDLKSHTSI